MQKITVTQIINNLDYLNKLKLSQLLGITDLNAARLRGWIGVDQSGIVQSCELTVLNYEPTDPH